MPSLYKLLLCIAFAFTLSGSHTFAAPVPKSGLGQGRSLSNSVAIGADKELTNVADIANYVNTSVRSVGSSDSESGTPTIRAFDTEDQALEFLKSQNEQLYNKAVEFRTLIKGKIDALNPDAKSFVEALIARLKSLRPKPGSEESPSANEVVRVIIEIIEKYRALSDEAKESLKSNFPRISGLLGSDLIKNAIQAGENVEEIPLDLVSALAIP